VWDVEVEIRVLEALFIGVKGEHLAVDFDLTREPDVGSALAAHQIEGELRFGCFALIGHVDELLAR
jgi:hypothetical protein